MRISPMSKRPALKLRKCSRAFNMSLRQCKETIERAKTTLTHRIQEQESEEQALTRAKSEVEELKTKNGELMSELSTLRKKFQSVYHSNVESLGKTR